MGDCEKPAKAAKRHHLGPVPVLGQMVVDEALDSYIRDEPDDNNLFPVGIYISLKRSNAEDVSTLLLCRGLLFRLFRAARVARFLKSQISKGLALMRMRFRTRQLNNIKLRDGSQIPDSHWDNIVAGAINVMIAHYRNLLCRTVRFKKCMKRLRDQPEQRRTLNEVLDEMTAMRLQCTLEEQRKPAASVSTRELRRSLSRLLSDESSAATASLAMSPAPEISSTEEEDVDDACSDLSSLSEESSSPPKPVQPRAPKKPLSSRALELRSSMPSSSVVSVPCSTPSIDEQLRTSACSSLSDRRALQIEAKKKVVDAGTPQNLYASVDSWGRVKCEFYQHVSYVRFYDEVAKSWRCLVSCRHKTHQETLRKVWHFLLGFPASKKELVQEKKQYLEGQGIVGGTRCRR